MAPNQPMASGDPLCSGIAPNTCTNYLYRYPDVQKTPHGVLPVWCAPGAVGRTTAMGGNLQRLETLSRLWVAGLPAAKCPPGQRTTLLRNDFFIGGISNHNCHWTVMTNPTTNVAVVITKQTD